MHTKYGNEISNYLAVYKFGFVVFYGIKTIVSYLMPISFYTYKLNIWFVVTFCR